MSDLPFFTPHAMERLRIHHRNAGIRLAADLFRNGRDLNTEEAAALFPGGVIATSSYRMSSSGRGVFVSINDGDRGWVCKTYMRLDHSYG